jgi:hypothetical protein
MADIIQERFCPPTGKLIYRTRGDARKAARAIGSQGRAKGGKLSPYVCGKCGGWHLGRK